MPCLVEDDCARLHKLLHLVGAVMTDDDWKSVTRVQSRLRDILVEEGKGPGVNMIALFILTQVESRIATEQLPQIFKATRIQ